jgi:hypothetical protein
MIQRMKITTAKLKTERLDFETHLKYARLLNTLSDAVEIKSALEPKLSIKDIETLKEKIKLTKLTKDSIDQEYEIVAFDKEYSTASVLWLPIKTYYLIYHLLCITDCLLTGNIKKLSAGHFGQINDFSNKLAKKELLFSNNYLNLTFDSKILNFKTKSGEHLKLEVAEDILYKLLMKKVAKEKIANHKISKGLDARKTADKAKLQKFTKKLQVSIFDYFYLMRLRTNYRNSNFIDDLPSSNTKLYFNEYYSFGCNFYNCFTEYINKLVKKCS